MFDILTDSSITRILNDPMILTVDLSAMNSSKIFKAPERHSVGN